MYNMVHLKRFTTVRRYRIKVILSSPETGKKPARTFTYNIGANTLLTKGNVLFKILAFLMAVLTFSMPLATLAQQDYSIQIEARTDAEADAEARTNKVIWFGLGCLGGWFAGVGGLLSVAGAYFYEPSPPSAAFLGKSPEYVAIYTDAYKEKAKSLQVNSAAGGCVVGALTFIVFYAAAIAAATANQNSSPPW